MKPKGEYYERLKKSEYTARLRRTAMREEQEHHRRIEVRRRGDSEALVLHIDATLRRYEEAYYKYNGRRIVLCYVQGIVRIDGAQTRRKDNEPLFMKPYRLYEIESMARELEERLGVAHE